MTDRLEEIEDRLNQMSKALVNELALIDTRWLVSEVRRLRFDVGRLRGAPLRQQADRLMQEVGRLEKDLTALRDLYDATYNVNMGLHDTIATLQDKLDGVKEQCDKDVVEALRRRDELRSVMSQAITLLMSTYIKSSHADAAIALMNKALGTEASQ